MGKYNIEDILYYIAFIALVLWGISRFMELITKG